MLNLVDKYDFSKRTPLNTHRLVEILKFGFAARTRICDPMFTNDTERIDKIPTKEYADIIFANITDNSTHPPEYYRPEHDIKIDHGTSHSSIIDKDGMAVAITSTVNLVFGSQVLDHETGIILNDEMDDFGIPGIPNGFGLLPSPYNYPEPGKRPLSSTAPTIIEHPDGSVYLIIGAAGGSRIFGAIFQTILNLDWGLDVSGAIEYGRLHDQLYPAVLLAENIYPKSMIQSLRDVGHNVTITNINSPLSIVQAIQRTGDGIYAASDSRKHGIAAGY